MTQASNSGKFRPGSARSRRALPCLVPGNTCRITAQGSSRQKICRQRRSFAGAGRIGTARVRGAGNGADAIVCSLGSCMTWATWWPDVPATSTWFTRSIVVPAATNTSRRTCPTTPCPSPITRIAWFPWPCDWSWRTACPIKPPVGICGGIIACSFPSRPSRTGWRPGGKKAARQMWTSYLDWALADFSGYIAVDELYDGPFCVLSIVDNRTFKRLLYQVLDHDPDHQDITAFLRRFRMALHPRLDVEGRHHRCLAPVSGAVACGVRRRSPSNLRVPHHQGVDQGDPAGRGPGAERVGGAKAGAASVAVPTTPAAKRAVRQRAAAATESRGPV